MTAFDEQIEAQIELALAEAERRRGDTYYDAERDSRDRESYYRGIGEPTGPALTRLLRETHTEPHRYDPPRFVYPFLDLHPDGKLRSIYSGREYEPEELIRRDAEVAAERAVILDADPGLRSLAGREPIGIHDIEAQSGSEQLEFLAQTRPYNCEHVVCQSWFEHEEPMRGDLHHLFACESGCNSFRGNYPYYEFGILEVVREECGRRQAEGFEPGTGKGAVARATLYFLLRYPGDIIDSRSELPADRLKTLLEWHLSEPPEDYEFHRNAVAAEMQGNRNPLIDHPEWAESVDFAPLWGRASG